MVFGDANGLGSSKLINLLNIILAKSVKGMHIVYKLVFQKRINQFRYPFYYIGSKSNCSVVDGVIYDKKNKPYWSSSNCELFISALELETPIVVIMYSNENYEEVVKYERQMHLEHDVVVSAEYFNKAIALETSYHNPNYATMRNLLSGKVCRVPINHPDVISGKWVGATQGRSWYNNGETSKTFYEESVPAGWLKGRIGNFDYAKENLKKTQNQKSRDLMTKTKRERGVTAWNKGKKGVQICSEETKLKMSKAHKARFKI